MEVRFTTELPQKEDLFNLYEHLDWNRFLKLDSKQLLKAMKGSYFSVYAYSENSLIATGRIISDGVMNAYLCGLGVHCDYRHKGIATKIIKMLIQHCRENNLHIQFFCEEHLVPFYEEMGFDKFAIGMKVKED
ncbi:GNAT family N-acetyltransferase [Clostridium sp.]|uniref:GNAT family N-acetyltransferase n=1 Tax=Clostridium sp. TaxID=1506 RepID=UPI002FCBB4A2